MKYLNKLFAFDDRKSSHQQSSAATLTSSLYSVTFISDTSPNTTTTTINTTASEAGTQHRSLKGDQLLAPAPSVTPSSSSSSCSLPSARIAFKRKQISVLAQASNEQANLWEDPSLPSSTLIARRQLTAADSTRSEEEELTGRPAGPLDGRSGLLDYFLSATIGKSRGIKPKQQQQQHLESGKTTAPQSIQQIVRQQSHNTEDKGVNDDQTRSCQNHLLAVEDDWILIDEDLATDRRRHHHQHSQTQNKDSHTSTGKSSRTTSSISKKPLTQLKQMALEKSDIELIRASWNPVRKDPPASGVLFFRGLFIKFPQYLKFFPQFSDLDLERMHENKRLLRHAVNVIDTVTFVVDTVGDDSKSSQLNDALVKLVKSHLRRKVGLAEFRNLGIVLIDFICDVVSRGGAPSIPDEQQCQLNKSSTSESINTNSSSIDAETMTSALDKLRASSSASSSSEEESYLSQNLGGGASSHSGPAAAGGNNLKDSSSSGSNHHAKSLEENNAGVIRQQGATGISSNSGNADSTKTSSCSLEPANNKQEAKIDTNLHLVAAWTKFYNIILDLVKREEAAAGE